MWRRSSARILLAILVIALLTPSAVGVRAGRLAATAPVAATPAPRDVSVLAAAIEQLVAASGATVGVTLIELRGSSPLTWSLIGSTVITAASTYKLAALMLEAETSPTARPTQRRGLLRSGRLRGRLVR